MKLNKQILKGNLFLMGILVCWLFIGGCAAQNGNITMEKISGVKWMHSHEEDEGELKVYRPTGFKFPPTRGRRGFMLFMENNTLISYDIAPTDGTLERKGKWEDLGGNMVAFEYPKEPNRNYKLELISYKKKKLTIKISK